MVKFCSYCSEAVAKFTYNQILNLQNRQIDSLIFFLAFYLFSPMHAFNYNVNKQSVVAMSIKCCCVVWLQVADLAPGDQAELYQRLRFERGVYCCGQWLAACYSRSHVSQWRSALGGLSQCWASHVWDAAQGLRATSLPATIDGVVWRKDCDFLTAFIHAGPGQRSLSQRIPKLPSLSWYGVRSVFRTKELCNKCVSRSQTVSLSVLR